MCRCGSTRLRKPILKPCVFAEPPSPPRTAATWPVACSAKVVLRRLRTLYKPSWVSSTGVTTWPAKLFLSLPAVFASLLTRFVSLAIDPAGKMGYALADAAKTARRTRYPGQRPLLVWLRPGCKIINVTTAEKMRQAVLKNLPPGYAGDEGRGRRCRLPATFACRAENQTHRPPSPSNLNLPQTSWRRSSRCGQPRHTRRRHCRRNREPSQHARDKLARKGVDAIVLNDVARPEIGFDSDRNAVTFLTASAAHDAAGNVEAAALPIASSMKCSTCVVRAQIVAEMNAVPPRQTIVSLPDRCTSMKTALTPEQRCNSPRSLPIAEKWAALISIALPRNSSPFDHRPLSSLPEPTQHPIHH